MIISAVLCFTFNKTPVEDSLSFEVIKDCYEKTEKQAAVLVMMPRIGNFYVDDIINVSLFINASSQSINAATGKITFPLDKLEVINISKTDSIITLWAQEPMISSNLLSNQSFITFSGGLPSPGFIGPSGLITTISFKVKNEGNAIINIEDGEVLANDGYGTNILATTTPTILTLLKSKIKADFNEDNKIDLFDISILLSNWGVPKDQKTDLDGDGKVDTRDLSIILSKWTY